MPPKKAAPAAMVPTKASFFMSMRSMEEVKLKKQDFGFKGADYSNKFAANPSVPKQRFLYNKETSDAYAEVVGDTAVCLETGIELFRFGRSRDEDGVQGSASGRFETSMRFDFTPPGGKRHPGERFVDVSNLVRAGILSDADIASQRAFSDAELRGFMTILDAYSLEAGLGAM